jgi:hypothetical protein
MGYHIILNLKCQLLPEFIPFIRDKYLRNGDESDDEDDHEYEQQGLEIPVMYSKLLQIWKRLDIGQWFYEYDLTNDGIFTCQIEKKPYNHRGDLWTAYEEFLKHIIVPISSDIINCSISEDDCTMREEIYTDSQLRNIQFRLREWVEHIEHVYENDMIVETRVIYKRPFKRSLETDVTRMYK